MPRLRFEKQGNAIWISHLDLMRLFQRAFKRAGLPLTHTKGFNPRPSVSIALPLSVGVSSKCELLDFDLDGVTISDEEIRDRLNRALVSGVRVQEVYQDGRKIRDLSLLECVLSLEYDKGIPDNLSERLDELFSADEILVEKKGKNGITEQNIKPMIHWIKTEIAGSHELQLRALVNCQNPSLNPMQLYAAINKYLPDFRPDFVSCQRAEIFDDNSMIFR